MVSRGPMDQLGMGAKCKHCGGRTSRGTDEEGATVDKCFACSKEVRVHAPEEDAYTRQLTKTPDPIAWTTAALRRLSEILTLLARAETLKYEAERTYAALEAFGVRDLPVLAWKTHKPSRATRHYNWGSCSVCGVGFTGSGRQQVKDPVTKAKRCKDVSGCAARVSGMASEAVVQPLTPGGRVTFGAL